MHHLSAELLIEGTDSLCEEGYFDHLIKKPMKTEKTFKATIHVGLKVRYTGEVQNKQKAFDICQNFVDEKGECVSFTETKYIYTDGNEKGLIIEFIQYPRFPRTEQEITSRALALAKTLMEELKQYKATVICPEETYMLENESMDVT